MGLADSGGPYVYGTFAATTRADFVSGLKALLVSASWTAVAATGGWTLTGTSPQGLTVDLKVWDPGSGTQARVQFSSSSTTGAEHKLAVGVGKTYQCVANPCQLFVSRPSVAADVTGSAVCGGIPYIATDIGTPADAWWASGDCYDSVFFFAVNPRIALLQYISPPGPNFTAGGSFMGEAVWDGLYCEPFHGSGANINLWFGEFEIATITPIENVNSAPYLSQTLWFGDTPILYEPMVAWGDDLLTKPVIRGQIWDAVIVSLGHPMEDTEADEALLTASPYSDFTWLNYTDQYNWGSLFLVTSKTATATIYENVAF